LKRAKNNFFFFFLFSKIYSLPLNFTKITPSPEMQDDFTATNPLLQQYLSLGPINQFLENLKGQKIFSLILVLFSGYQ